MSEVLSGKRLQILNFIADCQRERGYPPSVREIGEAVGLASSATVHTHLGVLQREGYLSRELELIAKLDYARYFLTVHDVVSFARRQEQEILCQGRGSAANERGALLPRHHFGESDKSNLLFARFISENRGEPPDIDVDFEHERREKVIQYIYRRYGRHRAAICSTVVHYRSRRAIREVGKVLGLTEDVTAALAKTVWGYGDGLPDDHIRQAGLDPANPAIRQAVELADALIGFPRHLSQHVGGFVLTRSRLDGTVRLVMPRWKIAPSSSGTRTTSTRSA